MRVGRTRYLFLDGLRGLAALYVVFFHARGPNTEPVGSRRHLFLKVLNGFFSQGSLSVVVFIVLSGFCLMLPLALDDTATLRGRMAAYAKRRAKRILPPYYAALAVTLLVTCLFPSFFFWDQMRPPYSLWDVASHVLMVHNFSERTNVRIDPPMWSVAAECDVYVLFPILLLPVYRRAGLIGMILVALVAGYGPELLTATSRFSLSWVLLAFTSGAVAAVISHRRAVPVIVWAGVAIIFMVGAVVGQTLQLTRGWALGLPNMLQFVIAASALLGLWTTVARDGKRGFGLKYLEYRPVIFLGTISYSLYLFHFPILAMMNAAFTKAKVDGLPLGILMSTAGVGTSICIACVCHRLFERPFMRGSPSTNQAAAVAAVVEPAP